MKTKSKGIHTHIPSAVAISIIVIVAILSGAWIWQKSHADIEDISTISSSSPVFPKKVAVSPISFTKNQTAAQKTQILMARIATVSTQPLYASERKAIFAQYGNLGKSNLTEIEKQQLIRALNTH